MSRIGKHTIQIPSEVTVELKDGQIKVKGPKGELKRDIHPLVMVEINDQEINVKVTNEEDKKERSLWGTFGSHIKNMVQGVSEGFGKQLEVNGVGYKVALQGKDLKLDVGYSHPVIYKVPEQVRAGVEKNQIILESADKEILGRVAAEIRSIKKPEPYKGKGIKYTDEVIRRKAGKAAKTAA